MSDPATAIHQVVVVSDLHSGDALSLCPKKGFRLDDGGWYRPSKIQGQLWEYWREFWDRIVPMWTKGDPYGLIFNGDSIEGCHHRSLHPVTDNLEIQRGVFFELMEPEVRKAAYYYHLRGTEAHVQSAAQAEEALAKGLGAAPDRDGRFSRYILKKRVGGGLVDVRHHVGASSRTAYTTSAPMGMLTELFVECGRWGKEMPQAMVRSHRHQNVEIRIPSKHGHTTAVITPAWQLATPYVHRLGIQGDPQVGGVFLKWGEEDGLYTRSKVWGLEPPEPE